MIEKIFEEIEKADIDLLIETRISESKVLDYKREINISTDNEKKEFLADVSSFANTSGGDILYGIEEAKDKNGKNTGEPLRVCPLDGVNYDSAVQRIEQILRIGIQPRFKFHIKKISGFGSDGNGYIILVRIPQSDDAPHMMTHNEWLRFYCRHSTGKYPLDASEIRNAFLASMEEDIHIQFPAIVISHNKSGEPLEKRDERYDHYFGSNRYQLRRFLRPLPKNEKLCYDLDRDIWAFHFDVLYIEMLSLLFTCYQESQDIVKPPMLCSTRDPMLDEFPGQSLQWKDFIKEQKANLTSEIIEILSQIKGDVESHVVGQEMSLPSGTSIRINCDHRRRGFNLKNEFCEVNCTALSCYGYAGLGEWGWILGFSNKKSSEYWSSAHAVILTARFEKTHSLRPDMYKYKKWVDSLFSRLQSCLDSDRQIKSAREKYMLYKDKINKMTDKKEKPIKKRIFNLHRTPYNIRKQGKRKSMDGRCKLDE